MNFSLGSHDVFKHLPNRHNLMACVFFITLQKQHTYFEWNKKQKILRTDSQPLFIRFRKTKREISTLAIDLTLAASSVLVLETNTKPTKWREKKLQPKWMLDVVRHVTTLKNNYWIIAHHCVKLFLTATNYVRFHSIHAHKRKQKEMWMWSAYRESRHRFYFVKLTFGQLNSPTLSLFPIISRLSIWLVQFILLLIICPLIMI